MLAANSKPPNAIRFMMRSLCYRRTEPWKDYEHHRLPTRPPNDFTNNYTPRETLGQREDY